MFVKPGAGGWALFSMVGAGDAIVRVRFALAEDGRLEPAEVHVEGRPTLTGDTLRNVPLGALEGWANGVGREELTESITEAGTVEQATDQWLTAIGDGERDLTIDLGVSMDQARRRSLRLRIPKGPKRPDSFYRKVAEMYSALTAAESHRPASEIAKANEVPPSTVHRWIKEARRRDLLAPGRPGKAG